MARRSIMLGGVCLFLALLILAACQSAEYSLTPTRCDEFCAVRQRLHCANDDPADCVSSCEMGQQPWFSPRPGPCDREELTLLDCQRATPESAYICLDGVGTWPAPNLCEREQKAVERCRFPISGSGAAVCDAWLEACSLPDGGPGLYCFVRYPDIVCPQEQALLYTCMLRNAPECDLAPPMSRACAGEVDALLACNPEFGTICLGWSLNCAQQLGLAQGAEFDAAQARYFNDCFSLRPNLVRGRPCSEQSDELLSCLFFSAQRDVCDVTRLAESCAEARAAFDACTASPGDVTGR